MAKLMLFGLKTKLGLMPDFAGMKESTANTSLEFHAGDQGAAAVEIGGSFALSILLSS